MPKWEIIAVSFFHETNRMKVPGGWLVRETGNGLLALLLGPFPALIFIPDPDHEWKLG